MARMDSIPITKQRCPSCGKATMITDDTSGEMFCGTCGFVITDKISEDFNGVVTILAPIVIQKKGTYKQLIKDLILKQLNFKKESHYLELGETGLTKNLSTTGG